jgi:hypothetical protein
MSGSPTTVVGFLCEDGTPGITYGVRLSITLLDSRQFNFDIALPIMNVPLPILPAGYFDPSLNFSDPRNSMYL